MVWLSGVPQDQRVRYWRAESGDGGRDEQADAITDAVRQAAEHDTETLSTKADLHGLKADLHALEARLTWCFAGALPLPTFAILGAVFAMLRLPA